MINRMKERDSNFELLRIFAMFLIVLFHVCGNGVFSYWHNNSSQLDHINNFFCFLMAACGEVGVTLFILISGYFSCRQEFKLSKLFNIYFKTLVISISIFILFPIENQKFSI